jgi:hypothetical protein
MQYAHFHRSSRKNKRPGGWADMAVLTEVEIKMQEQRGWRDILTEVIRNPHERQRLVRELGVNSITLSRWASNQARPRPQYRDRLIEAMPEKVRQEFAELLAIEFPENVNAASELEEEPALDIPSPFYARIFSAYTSASRSLRSSSILALILQQMLAHLDPAQEGLSISIVRFTRPLLGERARSLQEFTGRGTSPFDAFQELQLFLLGADTLAGAAVTRMHPQINQNLREESYAPFLRTQLEESAMACPLLFEDRIAGCSLVASNRANYFTPTRQQLIQDYTNLMVLAFSPEDFYDPSDIALALMPPRNEQQPFFDNFRQRVERLMWGADGVERSRQEAELAACRQIEEEMIRSLS